MIPVCEPLLEEKELAYVADCLKTNWISSKGKYIEAFEEGFAHYCGCKYGIATTSGTTALHLALASIGIGPGDEVIVPAFTMAATVFAIIYTGAKPVLVDAEPDTWNIDPAKIKEKVTSKTKVILPVHIYGHPCEMEAIMEVAGKYNLWVTEDAAEAHGAEYKGKKAGSLGHLSCFSFYANKIITTGEGGMVITNNEEVAQKARLLKDLAFSPEKRFLHNSIGFNYRMTNIQAAIGLGQLEKIDDLIAARRRNAYYYNRLLKDLPGITLPVERKEAKNVYWMYGILIEDEFGLSRDELMFKLKEKGIETRTFFYPMHQQPAFQEMGLFAGEKYPVAEALSQKGLYLPSGSGLKKEEIEAVCQAIKETRGRIWTF
ncbi:MAG: DegT/DnrJ/EryC1/StrS family aminotransferase [Peptococcaceae bacterium]